VDISVVAIQKYAYSQLKPKVHPTEVASSAKDIVGDENCDNREEK